MIRSPFAISSIANALVGILGTTSRGLHTHRCAFLVCGVQTIHDHRRFFFIRYGHDLRYPKGYVCRPIPAEYEEADCEVKSENLFPLEVLIINH
ncbi:hypothetical protein CRE_24273 [Caenorhabditis remanei]|uniref:Uncharacterized protein n=1 Tax=Caenorhabditis remanei TaxID=31234 RepID=E3NJ33_CAERE|nr:hypothetical protein CRE_24273 [Caenorhabditis remanei]